MDMDIATFLGREPTSNGSVGVWQRKNNRLQLHRIEDCPCEDGQLRTVRIKSAIGIDHYRARTKVRGRTITGIVDYGDLPRTGWRFLATGKNAYIVKGESDAIQTVH